jgi:transcription factor TFIIIB component B''
MDAKFSHFLNNSNFKGERRKRIKVDKGEGDVSEESEKGEILKIQGDKIIMDETKMYIKRDRLKNAKKCNEDNQIITSLTFTRKLKNMKWSKVDTELFYRALEMCGTEFTLISELFRDKTRKQIKNKFLKEEKNNPQRISDTLKLAKNFDNEAYENLKNFSPKE